MKYNTLKNLKWILEKSWFLDKLLFVYIVIYTITNSIQPLILVVLPKVILEDVEKNKNFYYLRMHIFLYLFIYFMCFILSKGSDNLSWPRYIVVRMKIKKWAANKFMTMKQADIENPNILDLCERANQASSYNVNGFEGMFRRFVKILGVLGTFLGCATIISRVSIWMVILIGICVGIHFVFNTNARRYEKKMNDMIVKYDRKRDYIFKAMYNFKNGKDIRLYHMHGWFTKQFQGVSQKRRSKLKPIEIKKCGSNIIGNIMAVIVEFFLYVLLFREVLKEGMCVGEFLMCSAAIRTLFSTLSVMLDDLAHIRQQSLLVNDLIAFVNYKDEEENVSAETKFDCTRSFKIEFRKVSFQYPGSQHFALKNLSLVIDPGEKLGVVGLNGSGKTTMIKLLTRLYEPTNGKILINDIDISTMKREQYYRLFSVVFQDIMILAFSILENVSMSKEEETNRERVILALREAGLYDKIKKLPAGVDTKMLKIIDEEGVELSGGENQKLALARSIYRTAPYLILDEPTAALDAIAEQKIYTTFHKIVGDKTAIFISHRLASTKFCDKIAMFENGNLIEYGTHETLIKKQGSYYKMFQVQGKYYRDEGGLYE